MFPVLCYFVVVGKGSNRRPQLPKRKRRFRVVATTRGESARRTMEFLFVILLIPLLVLSVATFAFTVALFLSAFSWGATRVPFVPVRREAVADIIEALELSGNSTLYDLGSGDGRVLFEAAKRFPAAKLIGIEKSPLPLLISKFLFFWRKRANVSIISGNFFNVPLHSATHIFTYLSPRVMDELLPKLERELTPGTRLVACDFIFSKKTAAGEIDLNPVHGRFKLSRRLYVYVF